jgi:hypothetical protein
LFSSFPNIWTAMLLKRLLFFPSFCRLGMDIYIYIHIYIYLFRFLVVYFYASSLPSF